MTDIQLVNVKDTTMNRKGPTDYHSLHAQMKYSRALAHSDFRHPLRWLLRLEMKMTLKIREGPENGNQVFCTRIAR